MRVRVRRGRGAPSPELSPVCALVWGFLWLSVRALSIKIKSKLPFSFLHGFIGYCWFSLSPKAPKRHRHHFGFAGCLLGCLSVSFEPNRQVFVARLCREVRWRLPPNIWNFCSWIHTGRIDYASCSLSVACGGAAAGAVHRSNDIALQPRAEVSVATIGGFMEGIVALSVGVGHVYSPPPEPLCGGSHASERGKVRSVAVPVVEAVQVGATNRTLVAARLEGAFYEPLGHVCVAAPDGEV